MRSLWQHGEMRGDTLHVHIQQQFKTKDSLNVLST